MYERAVVRWELLVHVGWWVQNLLGHRVQTYEILSSLIRIYNLTDPIIGQRFLNAC